MIKIRPDRISIPAFFSRTDASGKTALALATWFGAGLFPVAPGTVGTLAAIPFAAALCLAGPWTRIICLFILTGLAVWSSDRAQDILKKKDPTAVVIDEVAGYMLSLVFLPLSWISVVITFFMFRVFDVLKPFPIRHLERLKGGLGIVADDLLAGAYAGVAAWVALKFFNY